MTIAKSGNVVRIPAKILCSCSCQLQYDRGKERYGLLTLLCRSRIGDLSQTKSHHRFAFGKFKKLLSGNKKTGLLRV
jgi:hypothetical protein